MDVGIVIAIVSTLGAVLVAVINAFQRDRETKRQSELTRKKLDDNKDEYAKINSEQNEKLDEQNKRLEEQSKIIEEQNERLVAQSKYLDEQSNKLDEIIKGNAELKEGTMQLLGSEIDRVYFKYKGKDSIPLSEYQNIKSVFEIYDKLGGNGERRKHWLQIDHLSVVNDDD